MERENEDQSSYEPTREEQEELERMLREDEDMAVLAEKLKNRKIFTFVSESHFEGWLKIHGIKWSN
jgi:hypothetical protein